MKRLMIIFATLICFFIPVLVVQGAPRDPGRRTPMIQIAILLDTSNSMDGLINQAKTQIWKIINELAPAQKAGCRPRLEVALYQYGNNNLTVLDGYIQQVAPLTTDLDQISAALFSLITNGGDEYCGQVIETAAATLRWSKNRDDFKMIVIAGNEPFTQGGVDYRRACRYAFRKGIVVNTIFCGNYQEGLATHWKAGADLAAGAYGAIDQDYQAAMIAAPQDDEILRLGQELNQTYLPYGRTGGQKKELQSLQDCNAAAAAPAAIVERTFTKASGYYDATTWDLVDRVQKEGYGVLERLPRADLPPELQTMSGDELKKLVAEKIENRVVIKEKLSQLNREREAYLKKEAGNQRQPDSFAAALLGTIRKQVAQKGFQL